MRGRVVVTIGFAVAALAVSTRSADSSASTAERPRSAEAKAARRPPSDDAPRFVENAGQMREDVAFATDGRGLRLLLSSHAMTLALEGGAKRAALEVAFDGARDVRPRGESTTPAMFHYFRGHDGADRPTHARTFAGVAYDEPWPGVDVRFDARPSGVAYSLIVRPGADVGAARFLVRGASRLERTKDGGLAATTPLGVVAQSRPVAWQDVDGARRAVDVAFDVGPRGDDGSFAYRFAIGAHDASRPVVVDPTFTLTTHAVGKAGVDGSRTVALDLAGNVYTADIRISTDVIESSVPSFDRTPNGHADVVLEKYDDAGTLLYATYFGGKETEGSGNSGLAHVAVDAQGRAAIAGVTVSPDLPVKLGPQSALAGSSDAFVAKFAADGASLVYGGYLGGKGQDECGGLALGPDGSAYVVGTSSYADFPVTGSLGPAGGNPRRGFVAKVDDAGRVVFAYMLGAYVGDYAQYANAVAVDRTGSVYVAGTTSGAASLPAAPVVGLPYNAQLSDGFVVKFNSSGTSLAYATYLNGAGSPISLAVDSVGAAYVVGRATGSRATFPFVVGPETSGPTDPGCGFIAKLASTGDRFEYCGYVGELLDANAATVDPDGRAWVTGFDFTNDSTVVRVAAGGASAEILAKADGASDGLALDPDGDAWFGAYDIWGTLQSYVDRVTDESMRIAPPDQIDAELTKPRNAHVAWHDADPNVTGFQIERATGTTNFARIARVSAAAFSFDDADIAYDTQYTYRVRAEIGWRRSHPSATWSIRTLPDLGPSPPETPPPPPTIVLHLHKARVVDGALPRRDSVVLAGSVRFDPLLGDHLFDPAADAVRFQLGSSFEFTVPAGDARWTNKKSHHVWRNVYPGGAIRLVIDLERKQFSLRATGTDLGTYLENPVSVRLDAGNDFATWSGSWRMRTRGLARIASYP
jgi:hypothetical protein